MEHRDKLAVFIILMSVIIGNGIFNNWTQALFGFPPSEELRYKTHVRHSHQRRLSMQYVLTKLLQILRLPLA